MSAREEVLARLRASRDAGAPTRPVAGVGSPVPRDYRRTGEHAPGGEGVLELLVERVEDYRAGVHRVATPEEVPALLVALLGAESVAVPPGLDPWWVAALRAGSTAGEGPGVGSGIGVRAVHVDGDPQLLTALQLDAVDAVVTASAVSIAETGTIVLDAGDPSQGRRLLSLVPDHHVCVVTADTVVQTVPEGLARLDPSTPLTLVSGPSATSDIELDRVEGVHGPRRLDVVVLG